MTHDEAQNACEHFATTSPERETHRWIPRQERDGGWTVVKIGLPPANDASTSETRADERPPTPDDPRTAMDRNIGPYGPLGA